MGRWHRQSRRVLTVAVSVVALAIAVALVYSLRKPQSAIRFDWVRDEGSGVWFGGREGEVWFRGSRIGSTGEWIRRAPLFGNEPMDLVLNRDGTTEFQVGPDLITFRIAGNQCAVAMIRCTGDSETGNTQILISPLSQPARSQIQVNGTEQGSEDKAAPQDGGE